MKRLLLSVLLVISLTSLSGCVVAMVGAAVVAGAGTVAYVKGELNVTFDRDIDSVYKATVKACDDLKLPVLQSGHDSLAASVTSRDAQDKKISISLKSEGKVTKSTIRVGTFGDEAKSQMIYDKIKSNL